MFTRREALAVPLSSLATAILAPSDIATAADTFDPTAIFSNGKLPDDVRLGPPKTLNGYFPLAVPKTKESWEKRRAQLREQILVATGLWPMPEKQRIEPLIHGKIEKAGYTIEKVSFASMPGHYVTGNLYRPNSSKESAGEKRPAILSPHGHWTNGRFNETSEREIDNQLKMGAEKFRDCAKYLLQARCAMLANLGFVVFHYDMVGTADSLAIAHREGFKDAAAELRAQSFLGLQTWNSIRALDFLSALPDVDPKRIGVTGASGGGTQTFILCAIDDRPAAAFPAVMVSTAMQGGCICENCSGLRVGTGNIEIAAMFAPKPLAMSGANDWTKEIMTKGYPELRAVYTLYNASEKVAARAWPEFPHNYNQPAREFMYRWFLKSLQGRDEKVSESSFEPVAPKELSVYDSAHPRPKDEVDADRLRELMTWASDKQMAQLAPTDAASFSRFREVIGTALRAMIHDEFPAAVTLRPHDIEYSNVDGLKLTRAVIGRVNEHDAIPIVTVSSAKPDASKTVLWIHPKGKASLFEKGNASTSVKALTQAGFTIVAPDLLGTGESKPTTPFEVDKVYAGFTYGYNRSLLANRVHDILTAIEHARSKYQIREVDLIGWGAMGPVAIIAKAMAGDAIGKLAADLDQFRFESIMETSDAMMLPGAVKYGGMAAFLALCAPGRVFVHNHAGTTTGKLPAAAYASLGASARITRSPAKASEQQVVEWLTD